MSDLMPWHDRLKVRLLEKSKPALLSCIEWTGAKTNRGYGHLSFDGKHMLAHRAAFEASTRMRLPKGVLVCHACDNPSCIKPEHLWIGSQSDNMKDAYKKGRVDVVKAGNKGRESRYRKGGKP
jgi:hypothetical protein